MAKARELMAAERTLCKAKRTTAGSLSFDEPELRPRGTPFGGASPRGVSHVGGAAVGSAPQKRIIRENQPTLHQRLQARIAAA